MKYLDSLESNVVQRIDSVFEQIISTSHGESYIRKTPVTLLFDKGGKLVGVHRSKMGPYIASVFWFNEGEFIRKTAREKISTNQEDILVFEKLNEADLGFIDQVKRISWRR